VELHPPYQLQELSFEVLDPDAAMSTRTVRSPFDAGAVAAIADDGFVVLRGFLAPHVVAAFRSIIEDVRAELFGSSTDDSFRSGQFRGQYIRDLHAHRSAAWDLMIESGLPDVVRCLAGPRIVMRSYSVRITHPRQDGSTVWHCDQRARVLPAPPWFTDAHSITVLGYMDAANRANGATELVAGSHLRWQLPPAGGPPPDTRTTIIGEPGDVLVFHGAVWHRAAEPEAASAVRRVLNVQFAPSWSRRARFDHEPTTEQAVDRLVEQARADGRLDLLELLGEGGYM
jgi:hypothetical protein